MEKIKTKKNKCFSKKEWFMCFDCLCGGGVCIRGYSNCFFSSVFGIVKIFCTNLHDNGWGFDIGGNGLVWQNLGAIDIDFILDLDIVSQHGASFGSCPFTNS